MVQGTYRSYQSLLNVMPQQTPLIFKYSLVTVSRVMIAVMVAGVEAEAVPLALNATVVAR